MDQNNIKILHVIPAIKKGGAEKIVCDLVSLTEEKGFNVAILTLYPIEAGSFADSLKSSIQRVNIQNTSNKFIAYPISIIWLLRNYSNLKSYDIIHAHLTFSSIFCSLLFVMFRLSGHKKTKVLETYHAVGMPIASSKRKLHLFLARFRDHLILMAEDSHWNLEKSYFPCNNVSLIPNGIKIKLDNKDDKNVEEYLSKLGLSARAKTIIGTVGQFRSERLPQTITKIFSDLSLKLGNEANFLFVGDGTEHDKCVEIIRKQGLDEKIFLPGASDDVSIPMNLIDIYLTLNVGPITGVAALEAIRAGCCVIALQLNENYERNADDFIWSTTDIDELVSMIVNLTKNRTKKAEISHRQQSQLIEKYNIEVMLSRYLSCYVGPSYGGKDANF